MDEKNQWGSEIKKQETSKKKTLSAAVTRWQLHQPAPSCNGSASWMSLMINHQANVALFGTSRSMLHQSRANLPRRMWSFFFHFPTFLGKSLSSYHLRQGKGPARMQFLHATKRQRKNENHPVRDESCSISNAWLRKTLHFVFFLVCFFFSGVGKNQWARVTRNKEKTRRGLTQTHEHNYAHLETWNLISVHDLLASLQTCLDKSSTTFLIIFWPCLANCHSSEALQM